MGPRLDLLSPAARTTAGESIGATSGSDGLGRCCDGARLDASSFGG
jgi:hypothetical protein